MKILVLDNYDSFTYNLVHIIEHITDHPVDVARNDEITLEQVQPYGKIVLSPGPGIPDEAGIMKKLIAEYASTKSILGVCLGMQGIAEVFGARLYNLKKVYHGIESDIRIVSEEEPLFRNLPREIRAGRYHSWAVDQNTLTEEMTATAFDNNGILMALRHIRYDVKGVQFHPESVMTTYGVNILLNWLYPDDKNIPEGAGGYSNFNLKNQQQGMNYN